MSKKVLNFATFGLTSLIPGKVGRVIRGAMLVAAGILVPGATALIGMGLAMGFSAFAKKPRVSPNATDRLTASMDANTGRKIWLGHTAGATDVRYQAVTGDEQEYTHWIMVLASHEVEGELELFFDTAPAAWTQSGGVADKYDGYLEVDFVNPGTNANGIAIDSTWTAACTLTGCAYLHLRFKRTGNDKKAESPFAQSIPSRITVRGKGALLPDIRETGVEADDQTTWLWLDDDSGSNPALQLLFCLIGWRIGGKLAVGRGIPVDRLDLDSFITAANLCDEPVTLALGGTEPRYRSDGLFSETDDPGLVVGNLTSAMNAVLRDTGGKLAVYCLHNDLATPVASFSQADIIEDGEWTQTPPIDEYFDTVRGRYVDPSDEALYQLVDYPEVSIASVDDIERIDTFDLSTVQSASQAQRLAKQRLQRNLYRGTYTTKINERGWQVNLGDVVEFSHVTLGWTDKLFRVSGHSIGLDGVTSLHLTEEHADIYAWDAEESPPVVAAVPTAYDALNSPLILAIGEAGPSSFIQDEAPEPGDSAPGVFWLDSDDGYRSYQRVEGSGVLEIGGDRIILEGGGIVLAWTPAEDQRIAGLGDDGILTIDEKKRILVPSEASREAVWAVMDGQASTLGIVTERTAASDARAAWLAFRNAISPAWDDETQPSPVDRELFRALTLAYDEALEQLQEAITARAAPVYQVSIAFPPIPSVAATYQGVISSTQFPITLTPNVTSAGASVRTDDRLSYSVSNVSVGGTGAVSVDNTAGSSDKGRVTITSAMTATFTFDYNVTFDGIAQSPIRIEIRVEAAQPPTGTSTSGGGTGNKYGSDSSIDTVSSGTYAQISDRITVDKATGETIRAYAPLSYTHRNSSSPSTRHLLVKWRYAPTGTGSWTDFAIGQFAGTDSIWDAEFSSSPGAVTANDTAAPSNAVYDVALWGALSASGGSIIITGTVSVEVAV